MWQNDKKSDKRRYWINLKNMKTTEKIVNEQILRNKKNNKEPNKWKKKYKNQ